MGIKRTIKFIIEHPLNIGREREAVMRFFKWQLFSRVAPGDIIIDWVNDSKLIGRSGETGVTGNIYCGLHEFAEMSFLLHALKSEDVFVDVGANVGSYTVLAGSVIGSKCYSFEPVPETYIRLMENIGVNKINNNVVARNIALGSVVGDVKFTLNYNCINRVLFDDKFCGDTALVKMSTLDLEICDVPYLIKIDVEGFELAVLQGAKELLMKKELKALIVEVNGSGLKYGFDDDSLNKLLMEYGFMPYYYDPFEREIHHIMSRRQTSGNVLFIRDCDSVIERVKVASKYCVNGRYV